MDDLLAEWKAARSAAARKALPKPIQQRADVVVRAAVNLSAALQKHTGKLLAIGARVDAQQKRLAEFGKTIENKSQSIGQDLWRLDSAPLWGEIFEKPGPQPAAGQEVVISWEMVTDFFNYLLEDFQEKQLSYVVGFLLCTALLLGARHRFLAEVGAAEAAFAERQVLSHPFSSAALLFLMAATWLASGTSDMGRIIGLLSIFPTVWLGPALVPAPWRKPLYVLIVFFVLEFVRVLSPQGSLSSRLFLLVLDLGAAGYCLQKALWQQERFSGLTGIGRILRELLLGAVVVMGAAAVSNGVGNLSFASFLTTAAIRLAYLGLIIYLFNELLSVMISLSLRTHLAQLSYLVSKNGPLLVSQWRWAAGILAWVLWLVAFFTYFDIMAEIVGGVGAVLAHQWQVGATTISLGNVMTFALVFATAIYLSRMLRFVFREEVVPRVHLRRGVGGAIDMLSNYIILLLGLLLALATAGVDLSKVTLVLSGLGVGLGFGLQNLVSNFVSGLILAFEHPVQRGDVVEVGSTFGEVNRIGFRASVVRTFEGAEIIIPNTEMVWGRVTNWTLSNRTRRIDIQVGAAYGTEPQRVLEILQQVALKHPKVLPSPAPDTLFDGFGDSSLNFILRAWTRFDDFLRVRSDLAVAINQAFNEAGISIPFPQRDLHIDWPEGLSGRGGLKTEA